MTIFPANETFEDGDPHGLHTILLLSWRGPGFVIIVEKRWRGRWRGCRCWCGYGGGVSLVAGGSVMVFGRDTVVVEKVIGVVFIHLIACSRSVRGGIVLVVRFLRVYLGRRRDRSEPLALFLVAGPPSGPLASLVAILPLPAPRTKVQLLVLGAGAAKRGLLLALRQVRRIVVVRLLRVPGT